MKTRTQEDRSVMGYLLGTASELEQSHIETRYFREPHFYEEMLALEEELICDYLNGALTPTEQRHFEQHFLATPRRQRKYESTRKLLAFVADQGPISVPAPIQAAKPSFFELSARWANNFLVPRLGFVWTLTSLAVLSVGVWMLSVQVSAYRQQVAQKEELQAAQKTAPKPRAKPVKQRSESGSQRNPLAGVADQLQASLDEPPAILTGSKAATPENLIAATLRPSSLRAAGNPQQITLPTETATLQLQLVLGTAARAQFVGFNIVLKNLNGAEIVRRHNLSPQVAKSDKSLRLDVPVSKLATGRYAVIVTGITAANEVKPADEYFLYINRN